MIGMPLVQAAMYGPLAAFTSEMFATGSRYTGASLGYQLSTTPAGGLVPVALFTAAACGLSLVVVAAARETGRSDISG